MARSSPRSLPPLTRDNCLVDSDRQYGDEVQIDAKRAGKPYYLWDGEIGVTETGDRAGYSRSDVSRLLRTPHKPKSPGREHVLFDGKPNDKTLRDIQIEDGWRRIDRVKALNILLKRAESRGYAVRVAAAMSEANGQD